MQPNKRAVLDSWESRNSRCAICWSKSL